jgi:ribosome-associated protein
MLDIKEVCSFADYFVVCSGQNERQIDAIRDAIHKMLEREGVASLGREGTADSGWVLLDFGDVVVHIFAPLQREYYQLDHLWSKATLVVKIQ